MNRITLTRYLYFLDECFYSLLIAMVTKSSFEEVLFWVGEIYYSGFEEDLQQFIWKLYYDFYATRYPKFEKKINRLSKGPPSIHSTAHMANILYHSAPTHAVFALRMLDPDSPSAVYTDHRPLWLKQLNLENNGQMLVRSIHNKQLANIAFYLQRFEGKEEKCNQIIEKYLKQTKSTKINNRNLKDISYINKLHILMARICRIYCPEGMIQKRAVYRKLDAECVKDLIAFDRERIEPLYKTLVYKRAFRISPLIGAFPLQRNTCTGIDYKDVVRLHWDYHAYNSPVWKKRIEEFNGKPSIETLSIEFNSDIDDEGFHERFYYEPDEQTKEVQDRSTAELSIEAGKKWLNSMLDDQYCLDKVKLKKIY